MKTAICMYGFLRTYDVTAASLIKHIINVNDADLFIFAPNNTGVSIIPEGVDITDYKLNNKNDIKCQDGAGCQVTEDDLARVYGNALKACELYYYDGNIFEKRAENVKSYNVMPTSRVCSMIYNMSNSVRVMRQYAESNSITYDKVILLRPDLAFYSDLDVSMLDSQYVYIPTGGGRLNDGFGEVPQYYVEFYKDVSRGIIIPHRTVPFTDQFIVTDYNAMVKLESMYDTLNEFEEIEFPFHPESMIYYKLALQNNKEVKLLENFRYEIFRNNTLRLDNAGKRYGIITDKLDNIDNYNNVENMDNTEVINNPENPVNTEVIDNVGNTDVVNDAINTGNIDNTDNGTNVSENVPSMEAVPAGSEIKPKKPEKTGTAIEMVIVDNVSIKFKLDQNKVKSLKEFVVKGLSKKLKYDDFLALNNVSFTVEKGDVVGIIGRNGSGKSTILKCIAGIYKPTSGKIISNGNIVPMLELGSGFDMEMTGQENIYLNGAILGYSKEFLDSKYEEIVAFSELGNFIYEPIRTYSSGMLMRLAFSIATVVNPEILIVDEILAVGDATFQEKSRARMSELMSGGTTVFFVSHDIEQIKEICNKVVWLSHGNVKMMGETSEVCAAYENWNE